MTIKKLGKSGLSGTSKKLGLADTVARSLDTQKTTVKKLKKEPMEIICDGDSWVFGCEIVDPEIEKAHKAGTHPGAYDFEPANDPYRRPRIFSTHLSKLLKCKVTNLSWPADDNNSIMRRTMEYITSEYIAKGRCTKNLFVMIGWSSPERNSFWYKDDKISQPFRLWPQVAHFDAKPQKQFWELYVQYLWNPEEYLTRYVFTVVQFQNFCRAHGISWMCWNSFYQTPGKNPNEWVDLDIKEELDKLTNIVAGYQYQTTTEPDVRYSKMNDYMNLWNTVDPIRFYKKDQPGNTFKSYIDQPGLNIKQVLCGWHPSPESHEAWAHELVRYIKQNKLLPK
jgi:hypothetical protein